MPAMMVKDSLRLTPQPGVRIIRREEYAHWMAADEIRAETERLAERLRERAGREYARRVEQGRAAGLTAGEQARLRRMLAFSEAACRRVAELESALEGVVAEAVRRLLGDLPEHEAITAIVRRLLREIGDGDRLSVSVHPDNRAAVEDALASHAAPASVRCDPALAPDCVRVESALGVVEVSVTGYLAALAGAAHNA